MQCFKTTYRTKVQADKSVTAIKKARRNSSRKVMLRPYKCDHCKLWHLTSQKGAKGRGKKFKIR